MEIQTHMVSEMTTAASPYNVTATSVIKACFLGVTAVLILLGNGMCLLVLRYSRDGVSPVTKLFLVSLTVSDLLVGVLVCVPIVGSTALQAWPFGETYCTLVASCHVLYFNAGLSVLAINIERYIAVMWPLRYPTIVTMYRAIVVEVLILAILLVWTLLYVLLPNRSAFYYNNFSVCFIDSNEGYDLMGQIGMTLFIALPMLITVGLHVRLFFLATHHAARINSMTIGGMNVNVNPSNGSDDALDPDRQTPNHHRTRTTVGDAVGDGPRPASVRGRQRANSSLRRMTPEAKAARTFFIMAVVAAVSWTPYYITISWENFRPEPIPGALAFTAQVLLLLNSLWNVIIYYTRNEAFRKTAHRILTGCCFQFRLCREFV